MSDPKIVERIAVWHAAGLIDTATAERLRADESGRVPAEPESSTTSGLRSIFGPAPTITEVLAYVGGAFVLTAWFVLLGTRASSEAESYRQVWAIGTGAAAIVAIGLGLLLRSAGERQGRAAGVLFVIGVGTTYGAIVNLTAGWLRSVQPAEALYPAGAALVAALLLRRLHPAMLTQAALIGSGIWVARSLEVVLVADPQYAQDQFASWTRIAEHLAVWGATAAVLAFIGLREAQAGDPAAIRRSGLTRLAAGMTLVLGSATVLTQTGSIGGDAWGRVLEPIVAEGILAALSVGLMALAVRRTAQSYLYPAALGIVIALSDFNASYVADQVGTGVALLLEGLLILAAGFVANRVRQRLGAPGPRALTSDEGPTDAT